MKHAYLYATFTEEYTQLGAILVQDDVIIGVGWNTHVSRAAVSEIEMALVTCQHSLIGSLLVSPMPPGPKQASLIVTSGITHVSYHKPMRELLEGHVAEGVTLALNMLREADIEITEVNAHLKCFILDYQGKDFMP